MKKKLIILCIVIITLTSIFAMTGCASEGDFFGIAGIKTKDVSKIEIVNAGGTVKVIEGDVLNKFMADLSTFNAKKDDNGYPDNSYDYKLRIYLDGEDGYIQYLFGQELTKVNIKCSAKESFYYFDEYEKARDLVAQYFYAQ